MKRGKGMRSEGTGDMIKLKIVQRPERHRLNQVARDDEYWRRIAAHILALPTRRRVRSVITLTVSFPRHPITHRLATLQSAETVMCAVSSEMSHTSTESVEGVLDLQPE